MSTAHAPITTRTTYEEEFVHMMDDVDVLIDTLTNPLHRKILINYRRHGLLEGDCRENGVSGLTALGVSGAGRSHHDRHSGGCGAI
ncbi:hypothetical protein ACLTEW_09940 [Gordonia lacunae]|uniref:hypothetical protein n=1 Tax=Gordonia lacunae TaxID=417102 RepID=UPI0039E24140